jgi:hypothetical protein
MPTHTAVKVGAHIKGFNKSIGRTRNGSVKRFWFGKNKSEAERKAAHILNVWELLKQRDGDDAAWDDETLQLLLVSANIDTLITLKEEITSSLSFDTDPLVLRQKPVVMTAATKGAKSAQLAVLEKFPVWSESGDCD